MDVETFWALIEQSGRETDSRAARLRWLEEELSRWPVDEIIEYHVLWTTTQDRGCFWDLYAAYWFVFGFGSLDGFEYFVAWLISLGREPFEKVLDCPDGLIELPEVLHLRELERSWLGGRPASTSKDGKFVLARVTQRRKEVWSRDENPEFERLGYVASDAYQKATGQGVDAFYERAHARVTSTGFPLIPDIGADFRGEKWDFQDEAEVARRIPRIAHHRGPR